MLQAWPITICLAVAYFVTGYAGLMLPAAGSHITLVWLPTGIAVATLYRWGFRCWPGVMIGALAVNLSIGTSFPLALSIAVGNTLGPLLATGILVQAGFHRDLKRAQDILLLTVAAMVGMLLTASVGVTSLTLADQLLDGQLSAWLIWWAGDVTGVIAAAPLILVTSRTELRTLCGRRIEFISWVASIILSIAVVFFFNGANGPALAIAFIPFPLLAWAAIRFGPTGTSLGVILLSFGAVVGTSAGYGPFFRSVPTDSVLTLSLFMATSAVVGWLVSALTVLQLEAVGTKRILELALEEVSFGVLVAGVDRRITYANSGFTCLTGYAEAEMLGKSCAVLQGPDTDPITSGELKAALHGPGNFEGDILNYRKDGSTFWNSLLISPILNARGEKSGFLGIQRDVTDRKLGQMALSQSQERFQAIFELEPECVKIVSPEGFLEEMNPAGLAMIEADSLEQFRGARLESLIATEDRAAFRALNERVTKFGESGSCKFAITGLKGTHRWLETHAVPYRNEQHEIVGLLAVTRDITQQKVATAELEQTVATLKLFIDSVPAMIAFVDADEKYRMVNRQYEQYIGLRTDQILDRRVGDIQSPEAYAVIAPRIREALGGENVHYQDTIRRPDGSQFWYEARYIPRKETDGRVLGFYVMVFDISERMRAEAALKESEARLNSFFFESPVGMAIFDTEGRWSHMNPTLAALNGLPAESHIRKRPHELLSPELAGGITASVRHILETGEADINREISGMTPAQPGVKRHWLFTHSPILAPDQRITGVGVVVIETTAQKQSEEALRASEERFRMYVDHAPSGVFVIDSQGRFTDVNPAACRQTGYSRDEILSMGIIDLTPPEALAQSLKAFEKLKADGIVEYKQPLRCKSSVTRWFTLAASRLSSGVFIVFTSDIQSLKETENALRQSRDRFEYLVSSCPAVIYTARTSGDYAATFISENVRSLLGYEPEQFLSEPDFWASRIHPDDAAGILEGLPTLLKSGRYRHEYRFLSSTGEYRWLDDEMVLSRDANSESSETIGYLVDITDRKHADEALQENETRLRLALSAANQGLYDLNVQTGECLVNPEYAIMLGYDPAVFRETNSDWRERLHPDDREAVYKVYSEYVAGERDEYRVEFRQRTKAGQWKWILSVGAVVARTAEGQPLRMLGTHTDISARKRVEEQLRQSNAILHAVTDVQREFLVDTAPGQSFERLLNLLLEQTESQYGFIGQILYRADGQPYLKTHAITNIAWDDATRAFFEQGAPEGLEFNNLKNLFGSVISSRQVVIANDPGNDPRRGGLPPGHPQLNAFLGLPLFHGTELIGMVGLANRPDGYDDRIVETIQPILATCSGLVLAYRLQSDQLRAAAALSESEERLRIFVENAPAGVAMFDRELKYLSYSRRWLTDYGLGEQSLIGRSHYEVFPEIPDRVKEIHRRCLTGVSERCEQDRFEHADGTADYLRWEIQPWTDASGANGGLVFFTESITDQVNAQEQLRASLREKESMLKEIHHRVKNNLQVISSLLSLQAASVTQPDALGVLAESQNRVRAMALVHETLYQSQDLADVDLSRYLGELCGYLFRSYGVDAARVRLDLDVEAVDVTLDKTIPCGLLVNEIVSNSLKHAFPGNRTGNITVKALKEPDGRLSLTLADDGIGLPADLAVDQTPSLGLRLIQILTEQIGGELTIERTGGTRFVLLFPNDQSLGAEGQ